MTGPGGKIALPFIGKTGTETASTCIPIVINAGLTRIDTSMKADGSYVNAIAFIDTKFQAVGVFGQINKPVETWEF